jgi:hypothetical protein
MKKYIIVLLDEPIKYIPVSSRTVPGEVYGIIGHSLQERPFNQAGTLQVHSVKPGRFRSAMMAVNLL